MPGPKKRYKQDPDGKGRGGGLYYHRGKGKHSKYSRKRDAMRISTPKGKSRWVKKNYSHTSDKDYVMRKGRMVGKV